MIDRGGGGDRGGYRGGSGANNSRQGYNQGGRGRDHDRRHHHHGGGGGGGGGGYQADVVDVASSEDDNVVEDAVTGYQHGGDGRRKRHRSSEKGHHKKKKRKRSKSRSRSPSRRSGGGGQGRVDRNYQGGGGGNAWDNREGGYQQQQRWDGGGRQGAGDPGPSSRGWNQNGPAAQPPNLMNMNPWSLDANPFDMAQQQMYGGGGQGAGGYHGNRGGDNQRGYHGGRDSGGRYNNNPWGGGDYNNRGSRGDDRVPRNRERGHHPRNEDSRVPRDSGGGSGRHGGYDDQEQRRLQVSQNSRNVFLEEVNLQEEFAFRLDTNSNPRQLDFRSIAMSQKSTYEGGMGKGIFGATEGEISQVYNKFHSLRCKLPDSVSSSSSSSDENDSEDNPNPKSKSSLAKNYIGFEKGRDGETKRSDNRTELDKDFDSYSFERKEGEKSIKERIEEYNQRVRNEPQNISLWKEFVHFQNKVFEESDQIFGEHAAGNNPGKKRKSNKKALMEKKISILEKALTSNPRNLQLNLLRLDYLLELHKPRHVLTEWKKLVTQYSQEAPFWIEYLLFSSSQLQIYTVPCILSLFETCFQKFRLMMSPSYPEFQRPSKFPLFISDITFALGLLLKSSGFMERAVALHQAQLEFDFNCPANLFKDPTLLNWNQEQIIFQNYWDHQEGHFRFGEPGALGWSQECLNEDEEKTTQKQQNNPSIAVSDKLISDFEEDLFDKLNEKLKEQNANLSIRHQHQPNIWLNLESSRSKLYWLPWRRSCSDVEDCEDAQRVVPSSDLVKFIQPLPTGLPFISDFDRQAAHFRHLLNLLMTFREDFTPHTQTIDLVMSPFLPATLTESSSLFSEIYYWRRLADLYVGINNSEPASKAHHVFAPEGFKLVDLVSPTLTTAELLKPALFDLTLKGTGPEEDQSLDRKRVEILQENDTKFMALFQNVLAEALDKLGSEFSGLLFEMWLRFEQKRTCTQQGNLKQRVKFAKGIMQQHEKLRNLVGGYRELAMLEYFGGGSTQKAAELLGKTINVTRKSLEITSWEQVDWEKDWRGLVDLVALYRQLAELFLEAGNKENEGKAWYALQQLGNSFAEVDYEKEWKEGVVEGEGLEGCWKPQTNRLLKATRAYEKVMTMLIGTEQMEGDGAEEEEMKIWERWGGDRCIEFMLQQRNLLVEWTQSYALFQFFTKDFEAASQVYEAVLEKLKGEGLSRTDSYNKELNR